MSLTRADIHKKTSRYQTRVSMVCRWRSKQQQLRQPAHSSRLLLQRVIVCAQVSVSIELLSCYSVHMYITSSVLVVQQHSFHIRPAGRLPLLAAILNTVLKSSFLKQHSEKSCYQQTCGQAGTTFEFHYQSTLPHTKPRDLSVYLNLHIF